MGSLWSLRGAGADLKVKFKHWDPSSDIDLQYNGFLDPPPRRGNNGVLSDGRRG
jgi:hypothetical protein